MFPLNERDALGGGEGGTRGSPVPHRCRLRAGHPLAGREAAIPARSQAGPPSGCAHRAGVPMEPGGHSFYFCLTSFGFILFIEKFSARNRLPGGGGLPGTAGAGTEGREEGGDEQAALGWHSGSPLFAFNTNCTVFSIHVCLATGRNMKGSLKKRIKFKGLSQESMVLSCYV